MASRTGGTPTVKQALAIAHLGAANIFRPLGHHAAINASTGSTHQHQVNSAESVSADRSAKSSVKKSIFRLWKKDHSNKDTEPHLIADAVEQNLYRLKLQRLNEYKQPVYIAPMAKPNLQAPDDTLFPLMEKVNDFLAGDSQVMLILGDSGAGKSTFNRHLEHELWKAYKAGDRIPLLINLPAMERPEKDLVAEQLRIHDLPDDQIRELKLYRQFMLICDGYDESQLTSNLHTTNLLNQSGQWDAKLLITCRTQYLGPDYRGRFVPKASNQYRQNANNLFREAVIAPFSNGQIDEYVERYVPLEPRTWIKEDYIDKLATIPNLMDLVKNPFLLTLCLEALPHVVRNRSNLSRLRVTRVQLYDTFVQHWIRVNKRRLQDLKLSGDKFLAFEELLEDGFEQNGMRFQQDLAATIFREQQGRPVVEYIHKRDRSSWKALFFSPDHEITLLRDASLLNRVGTQYRFVHRSILEYFYSCTMYTPSENNDKFAPHPRVDSSDVGNHPLSQRNLVAEPSIIQFLVERVQLDPGFKRQLLAFIEQSKTDEHAACAAANAITILVKTGVSFNNADLRGIRVPGADLSGGEFDSAQLQEADLAGVNLTRSWIRQADLSKARMEEVKFGELPFLEEDVIVGCIAYSSDGKSFAVGLEGGNINIYDIANWTMTRTLEGHRDRVSGTAYSPCGEQLLSGSWDRTVRLWNCKTGLTDTILEGHTHYVNAVAFSPAGNQIASASDDKTVRLWDSRTGSVIFVLQGHTGCVNSISFSLDGRSIVSAGEDSKIQIFDTYSGQMELVLETTAGVRCVAYSPDGLRIIAGNDDGDLQLWESATGESVKRLKGNNGRICAVGFSPDCQWIASSSTDRTVTLWEARLLIPVSVFVGHFGLVGSVIFSPNNLQLASGSWDGTVRLWDVTTAGAGLSSVANQSDEIRSVAYSPDGRSLISGDRSGTVRQYDVATGESGPLYSCGFAVKAIVFSPDGRRIAAAGSSNDFKTWNVDTGVDEYVLHGHRNWIEALAFSPDGQMIASGGMDSTVRLWNALSGVADRVLAGHDNIVVTVAFSPCGLQVVSGSKIGTVQVWDVRSGTRQVEVNVGDRFVSVTIQFLSTGMQIAFQREKSSRVELWHKESPKVLHRLQHYAEVGKFSLSPCSQWIAIDCNGSLWLWRLVVKDASQEWEHVLVIRDILKRFSGIVWGLDALEFATVSETDSIHAWKLVETPDGRWCVRLMWSSGRTAFTATDANIVDVVGLSAMNHRLLEQRGAKVVSLFA
jgi:WD40 repeat protein